MNTRAARAYRNVDLESAPKHLVLERLFGRFARDLGMAREGIVTKDFQKKASAIDHAVRILTEFSAALDHAAAPELCANLAALYDYAIVRLGEANTTLAIEPIDDVDKLMAEIGAAFRAASP